MASGPIISWEIEGEKMEAVTDFLFLGSKITVHGDWTHEIRKRFLLGRKAMTKLDSMLKQRHHFASKDPYSQGYGLSKSHVWVKELDHKEGWVLKNWCFQTVVLEKTLESPLDNKIKPVNPKGNQAWIFIGRTDAEAEAPMLWPPDGKSWLIGKDPDAGKYWRLEEQGATEDETVGWHHQLNEHEFEQAPGDGEGQGSLACYSPWGCKELDTTEQLNWLIDWCWSSNTLATWCEELTHWKRPWCWKRLRVGGEGENRGWDSLMASPTQWTWVWANSGR